MSHSRTTRKPRPPLATCISSSDARLLLPQAPPPQTRLRPSPHVMSMKSSIAVRDDRGCGCDRPSMLGGEVVEDARARTASCTGGAADAPGRHRSDRRDR